MARFYVHLPGPFSVGFGGRRRRRRAARQSGGGGGGCLLLLLAIAGIGALLTVAFYAVVAVIAALAAWWVGCAVVGAVWWAVRMMLRPAGVDTAPWPSPMGVQFWPLRFTPKPPALTEIPAGWYIDPELGEGLRWWDGDRWTEHTAPEPDRRNLGPGP